MKARSIVTMVALFVLGMAATPVTAAVLDALDCNGCVDTKDIGGGAVTSTKIKDSAVKTADLGAGSVTAAKVKNGAVNRAKIKSGAVTYGKLAPGVMMSGRVNSDGTLLVGSDGVASTRTAPGRYHVTFPVDVVDCVMTLTYTPGSSDALFQGSTVAGWLATAEDDVAEIVTADSADSATDRDFSIVVTCP
ncbi:MAG TPA: hypothetical protein VGC11_13320 [Acidimicrobiia bacterium]